MNEVIKILSIIFKLHKGNLRYKIAYKRILRDGYNEGTIDELDQAIYDYFMQKKTIQIIWEVSKLKNVKSNTNLNTVLTSFAQQQIPLIISATITDLNEIEILDIQEKGINFPDQYREITLYYRGIMNVEHEDWMLLPQEARVYLNYKTYQILSMTIFPFV